MVQKSFNRGLRWWVLIIAIINPFFIYLADALGLTPHTIAEVSMQYNSYFMPAGYAFSIWGVIYLSFIVYGIYQLRPAQQSDSLYDRLAIPFIAANILGMLWQVVFTNQLLTVGTIVILIMLVLSGIMFNIVKNALKIERYSEWLTVPFSIYIAWLSVANIANASVWLIALGWQGQPLAQQHWAIIMIGVATLLALFISIRFKDWIFPVVVAWTCIALYTANQYTNDTIATDAVLAAVALLIYTTSYIIWQYLHNTHEVHGKWLKKHDNRILRH